MAALDPALVSRRSFFRLAGAATVAVPILTEGHFARAAMMDLRTSSLRKSQDDTWATPPPGAVLINANENPLGPSKAACEAIAKIAPTGGRYDLYSETPKLTETFARQNGLKPEYVAVYAGSSEPLHYTVLAFTSPEKPFVTADPSYEAGMVAAQANHAPIVKVKLTGTCAHDLRAMIAAAPNGGVFYVCNPNNPTGTLTPREEIEWALKNKPKGSILLVDEAYIHLSSSPSVLDLVAKGEDLIVLRTFSKVYGMAGIRCGIAAGRPDLLARLQTYGMNSMPITGSAAANVSLLDPNLVPERKQIIADTRNDTFAFLRANNYSFIPSESNCFMIDTGRPGKQVIHGMRAENVWIGRTWPIWPNYVRVSVGTPAEMKQFQAAFKKVMSQPVSPAVAARLRNEPLGNHFPRLS